MERLLVTLSLGPVQSLIGAARRTRDLWCGSWLLSEAARAAAAVFQERQPDCLIFPCPVSPADLKPQDQKRDAAKFANVLRAEVVMSTADARILCEDAKSAADARLKALGESARSELERLGGKVRDDVWQAQIGDILEGYAAWVPVPDGADGYCRASKRLGGVLAARKATRDFPACAPIATPGLPKSSLDGARETVLPIWPDDHRARRKLSLADGEQLDSLGMIKRMAGDSEQFTAYPRIAADSWLTQLTRAQRERLSAAYATLVPLGLATGVRGNAGIYSELPFDGQMLYAFRLDNALSGASDQKERQALEGLQACTTRIAREKTEAGRTVGAPVPYGAVLKGDGDRMGALLTQADSAERARAISRKLHGFASQVPEIVRQHRGHAIYAGGDDLLALVPLAQALDCAAALADAFTRSLGKIAADMNIPADQRPTLSVGVGIGHAMEPLGALRDRAERAEHAAKGDDTTTPRNALAIALGIRSGAELHWRARWGDKQAFAALRHFTAAFREDLLPTRVAYDLRSIDQRLKWLRDDRGARACGMRTAEVDLMLDRARSEAGSKRIPPICEVGSCSERKNSR